MATTSINAKGAAVEPASKFYVQESSPETHYGKIYGSSVLTVAGTVAIVGLGVLGFFSGIGTVAVIVGVVAAIPVCAVGISGQIYWIKIDWDEFRRCQTIHEENSRKAKEELKAQDNPCKRGWAMVGEPPQSCWERPADMSYLLEKGEGSYDTKRPPYRAFIFHCLNAYPVIY